MSRDSRCAAEPDESCRAVQPVLWGQRHLPHVPRLWNAWLFSLGEFPGGERVNPVVLIPQIPKPSGGSSYPGGGVNSYQAPSGAGFGYDEVGSGQDFKVYGGMSSGGLGKPHPLSSSGPDLPSGSAYKQHTGFDSSKTSYSTYSVPQGGYGFIPTGVSALAPGLMGT